MNCPTCNVPLAISERQNVEIDYCPQCRGVWLDRGELDKIIQKSSSARDDRRGDNQAEWRDDHRPSQYRKKKREGFLGELFDF